MRLCHERMGHIGSGKIVWTLGQACTWPSLRKDVRGYTRACRQCQMMRKDQVIKVPLGEMPIHSIPGRIQVGRT